MSRWGDGFVLAASVLVLVVGLCLLGFLVVRLTPGVSVPPSGAAAVPYRVLCEAACRTELDGASGPGQVLRWRWIGDHDECRCVSSWPWGERRIWSAW